MSSIVLDESTLRLLGSVIEPTELRDGAGRVLGKFIPTVDLTQFEPVTPNVTPEELDRRRNSTEWLSTDEVLARLETR